MVHTELCVSILIPLIEVEIEKLKPMEVGGMTNEPRGRVRTSKDAFAGFKVLDAEPCEIQRVVAELTFAVVSVAMESVDSENEVVQGCLAGNGTCRNGRTG